MKLILYFLLDNKFFFTAVSLVISSGHRVKLIKAELINRMLVESETVRFVNRLDKIDLTFDLYSRFCKYKTVGSIADLKRKYKFVNF